MATGPYSACSNTEPLSSSRLKLEPKLNKNIIIIKKTTQQQTAGLKEVSRWSLVLQQNIRTYIVAAIHLAKHPIHSSAEWSNPVYLVVVERFPY